VARQDMALGLMCLFRPLKDGAERRYLENIQQTWVDGKLVVNGPELSSYDQDVLLALLAIALPQIEEITPGKGIAALRTEGVSAEAETLTIRTGLLRPALNEESFPALL